MPRDALAIQLQLADQLRASGKTDQYVDEEIAACRAALGQGDASGPVDSVSNEDDPTASSGRPSRRARRIALGRAAKVGTKRLAQFVDQLTVGACVGQEEHDDIRASVAPSFAQVTNELLHVADARLGFDPDTLPANAQQQVPGAQVA